MELTKSKTLFNEAKKHIPGGVNSPVRAFNSVGGDPLFIKSAKGAIIRDVDNNEFIDLINSWGPMILGHAHQEVEQAVVEAAKSSLSFGAPCEMEVEVAKLIKEMVPNIEKVRMVNSGTEATMSAARLARGYTGKDKILKFEGCYHGHGDSFLIAAGSGVATLGTPGSPGVTEATAKDTLTAKYNDLESVKKVIAAYPEQIACMIVEPVAGNMGCVLPEKSFLQGLRDICTEHGIVLIFDEVMTGFRLSRGGAQELYDVWADLVTYGKIIGGGMPVGAYGGKAEIMDFISPDGPVYQAGTLSGNPVAMASGYATLHHLNSHPEIYRKIEASTTKIVDGLKSSLKALGLDYTINQLGSMYSLFFTSSEVTNFEQAKTADTEKFGAYFREMLLRGIYMAPSQFESLFISAAIDDDMISRITTASHEALQKIHQ